MFRQLGSQKNTVKRIDFCKVKLHDVHIILHTASNVCSLFLYFFTIIQNYMKILLNKLVLHCSIIVSIYIT